MWLKQKVIQSGIQYCNKKGTPFEEKKDPKYIFWFIVGKENGEKPCSIPFSPSGVDKISAHTLLCRFAKVNVDDDDDDTATQT